MNKNIYLFEFDISHSGQKLLIDKNKYERYFINYLLIADHIYLQASSPMKIKEIYKLFLKFKDCFKYNNIDEIPLVSFVLSKDIDSYEEYLDQRLKKLSNAHINPKKNFEYNSYRVNDAKKIAKIIDKNIFHNNEGFYIKKRETSADKLFRRNVASLFEDDLILDKYNINKKKQKEILKYPQDKDFLFQTFELDKILKNKIKIDNSHKLIKNIRQMYYKANQEAVRANSSMLDKHFNLKYINAFFNTLDIEKYILSIKNCEEVFALRKNEHFIYLKDIYFETISPKSLIKLKESFELGGIYKFINISYDYLLPLALAILLNGTQAIAGLTTFALFKDIAKDIIQNIVNRWLNTITNFNEYKIYQEKLLLKQSLYQ